MDELTENTQNHLKPGRWHAEVVSAASIKPIPITWVWPQWIARGKLTVLAGAGGSGKTTLAIGLIGTLTSGGYWPDGARCHERGNVLIWSSEDDAADTLVPRLMAAGADMSRVHIITGRMNSAGERQPFDPGADFDLLREQVEGIGGVALLMLDPMVNAVRGDMHRANDVRRSLQVVVDFAAAHRCALLGITHFSKGSSASVPADRVIGSQAFGALARTVLVAAKSPDSDLRVLARAKSNISDDQGGVSYTIDTCTIEEGIETTCVVWGGLIEGSAGEILAEVESPECNSDSYDDPVGALRQALQDGPINGSLAKKIMKESGFSEKQTRTAREKLGVKTIREGSGRKMTSTWSLP